MRTVSIGRISSDINDNNVTVGFGDPASGVGNVLLWDAAGRPTNLGSFGSSYAFASYTNRGDIAGMLDTLSAIENVDKSVHRSLPAPNRPGDRART